VQILCKKAMGESFKKDNNVESTKRALKDGQINGVKDKWLIQYFHATQSSFFII
jgi:hypothetical protein